MKQSIYRFESEVWEHPGESGNWHFASLPKKISEEIKKIYGANRKGWGSIPIEGTIGGSTWKTSLFPERKSGVYILPLKAVIRIREGIRSGKKVKIILKIEV